MKRNDQGLLERPGSSDSRLTERGYLHLTMCACGQELDRCERDHCPRCGSSLHH